MELQYYWLIAAIILVVIEIATAGFGALCFAFGALASALAALPRFDRGSGFAVLISGVVEKFFRQLLDIASGRDTGMAPFAVRKNQAFLRNWTVPELRAARYRFLMLREKAVSGTACADELVAVELVRTVGRRAR